MTVTEPTVGGSSMLWPFAVWDATNPSKSNIILDAASEKYAGVFLAMEDFTIDKVRFQTRTITTGADVDVRIETISATTGNPSGTLFDANTNVAHTIADTDDNVWLTTASLTASASISRGDRFAAVIVNDPTTPGNMALNGYQFQNDARARLHHDTGSWADTFKSPAMILENSGGTYMHLPGTAPFTAINTLNAIDTASTPDEYGVKFQLPFPALITGAGLFKSTAVAGGSFDYVVYDGADVAQLTQSVDHDQFLDADANAQDQLDLTAFASTFAIAANTDYRLVVKGTHASNTISVRYGTLESAGARRACYGGTNFFATERTDAGAWTDITTEVPFMQIVFGGFDDGAGGGGAAGHATLTGGMQ